MASMVPSLLQNVKSAEMNMKSCKEAKGTATVPHAKHSSNLVLIPVEARKGSKKLPRKGPISLKADVSKSVFLCDQLFRNAGEG